MQLGYIVIQVGNIASKPANHKQAHAGPPDGAFAGDG